MKLPDDETIIRRLSRAYGFAFPKAFAPLVRLALEGAYEGGVFADWRFLTYFGFRLEFVRLVNAVLPASARVNDPQFPMRFGSTPPEYFAFGVLGAGSVSYGYLVHAPELGLRDYPVVEEQPAVGEGVVGLGVDTARGLEALFSRELRWWQTSDKGTPEQRARWRSIIQQVAERYGIAPAPEKTPDSNLRVRPFVPEGWRYEPTSDGVGVLAPRTAFAPYDAETAPRDEPLGTVLALVRRALAENFPATALWGVREAYYERWMFDDDERDTLLKWWGRCYRALGRPLLARVVARMREDIKEER